MGPSSRISRPDLLRPSRIGLLKSSIRCILSIKKKFIIFLLFLISPAFGQSPGMMDPHPEVPKPAPTWRSPDSNDWISCFPLSDGSGMVQIARPVVRRKAGYQLVYFLKSRTTSKILSKIIYLAFYYDQIVGAFLYCTLTKQEYQLALLIDHANLSFNLPTLFTEKIVYHASKMKYVDAPYLDCISRYDLFVPSVDPSASTYKPLVIKSKPYDLDK